jgi:ligand-binding sensor domain-containing protein
MNRRLLAAAVAASLLLAAAYVLYLARRAESSAEQESRAARQIPTSFAVYTPTSPEGFEPFAAPADFRDAALFQNRLYIAGANTLYEYSPNGTLERQWTAGRELPPASLKALAAAPDKLWIATQGQGALAFDGQKFEHLLPGHPKLSQIYALLPLSSGGLLLAAGESGVLLFDGGDIRPFHPSLNEIAATALAGDDADLWIGTRAKGLHRLHAGAVTVYTTAEGLPDNAVSALAVQDEAAYAATPSGIAEFQSGRLTRTLAPGLFAQSLHVQNNTLHAGTLQDGWLPIPLQSRPSNHPPATAKLEIRKVFSSGKDLYLLTPSSLQILRNQSLQAAIEAPPSSLTDSNISALATTSDNHLWIGYFDRGLDILHLQTNAKTHLETEHLFCVNQITPAPDGSQTAVATANGLVLFDAQRRPRQTLTRDNGLIASHVTAALWRPQGWALATPAGLTFLGAGAPRGLYAFHGLVNNHVYALAAQGTQLAAGTLGGLTLLDGESVRLSYSTANSALKTNWITALLPYDGGWMAGTYGGGVQFLEPNGAWKRFDDMPANAVVNPGAIAQANGRVYAGTLEHGLLIFDPASRRWRATKNGLPSPNVTAIHYHGDMLFLGTGNGLVRAPDRALVPR